MPDRIFLGHTTAIVQATPLQRPTNATPYTSGDVIATNAGDCVIVFPSVARSAGGSGMIMKANLIDSANQGTQPSLELWLFKVRPTFSGAPPVPPVDNAAFNPTDADMLNLVDVITLSATKVGNAGAGAAGNIAILSDVVAVPFKCAGGDDDLYGVLVVRNGYTPVADETFTVTLTALQDY